MFSTTIFAVTQPVVSLWILRIRCLCGYIGWLPGHAANGPSKCCVLKHQQTSGADDRVDCLAWLFAAIDLDFVCICTSEFTYGVEYHVNYSLDYIMIFVAWSWHTELRLDCIMPNFDLQDLILHRSGVVFSIKIIRNKWSYHTCDHCQAWLDLLPAPMPIPRPEDRYFVYTFSRARWSLNPTSQYIVSLFHVVKGCFKWVCHMFSVTIIIFFSANWVNGFGQLVTDNERPRVN